MATTTLFPPTRDEGLRRLSEFAPRAGRAYADGRNADLGPDDRLATSVLSPYLRRRLITEREVIATILDRHDFADAGKYVEEVSWRTYWKGWLEMRPEAWRRFTEERDEVRAGFKGTRDLDRAEAGATGIDGFDDWACELVEFGYLHNHARMWFASIWIFTLRLPWTLGADFFMRHLIDADPASNTLSWRWVAGLQTAGKTYLATADNIARNTGGRFSPVGLATSASALTEAPLPAPFTLPRTANHDAGRPTLLLVTPEDMHPESVFPHRPSFAGALVVSAIAGDGDKSGRFVAAAAEDTAARVRAHFDCPTGIAGALDADRLLAAATEAGASAIAAPYTPVGPVADALATAAATLEHSGVDLFQVRRSWDERFWPHTRKGFFAFRKELRPVLAEEGLC
ncbi:FAD-binding domain-containing protein [uncultured Sphingomonas sp.]|uniref:FAD-binding domain-containing protein n=1 Tax=uncultured Sphingomonas sp. TaxID=158754 RepID=UPI0035CAA5F3